MNTIDAIAAVTLGTAFSTAYPVSGVVDFLSFANNGPLDASVTVTDGQGKSLLPAIDVPVNTFAKVPLPGSGVWFKNGVQWKASVAAQVDAWIHVAQ